eukprot:6172142-Pleurochrysis_carterae.AAC.1
MPRRPGDAAGAKALDERLAFMTPILKGFLTEAGKEAADGAIQVAATHSSHARRPCLRSHTAHAFIAATRSRGTGLAHARARAHVSILREQARFSASRLARRVSVHT